MDPIRMSREIAEAYFGYLSTTFDFRDKALRDQFEHKLREPGRLVRGPIVQATPPFVKAATLRDLVSEGILSSLFTHASPRSVDLDRPLYKHQEEAIRKMISGQRNVVVATGTGSGKTECFMIPVCNYLMREHEAGRLTPGVRALLLYPMNALANDQVKRLRQLFEPFQFISFGRYTGETLREKSKALDAYRNTFKCTPLPNELVSREQMWASPPHVLITNYAMLEYLLLRPDDNVFFDGGMVGGWRFIVLDEAHTYSGAKGIETAMLLRRLRDRVADGESGRLQCVATSATLGRGVDDAADIMRFASKLFSEDFEYDPGDPLCQDLVLAEREEVGVHTSWGRPDPRLYSAWQGIASQLDGADAVARLAETASGNGVPGETIGKALIKWGSSVEGFLHDVLSGDGNLIRVQQLLSDTPRDVAELAEELFGGALPTVDAGKAAVALISLAVRAKPAGDSGPLLPAKYHLMIRALNGGYVSFAPEPAIHLDRVESVPCGNGSAVAFDAGLCRNCGTTYIITREKDEALEKPAANGPHSNAKVRYYAVPDPALATGCTDDEDNQDDPTEDEIDVETYELCPICGAIGIEGALVPLCRCGANRVRLIDAKARNRQVNRCPVCGARDNLLGVVRRISVGADAAASVIATAAYRELNRNQGNVESPGTSIVSGEPGVEYDESGWAVAKSTDNADSADPHKLLVFSDSRQDAAYFAPYMQSSYERILRRNIVLDAAREVISESEGCSVLTVDLWRQVEKRLSTEAASGRTSAAIREEAQKWVLQEFMGRDRHGLERMGLLGFKLDKPGNWSPSPYYLLQWRLTPEEVWDLYGVMLDTLRLNGAMKFPKGVNPRDPIFEPRNFEVSVRLLGPDRLAHIIAWRPGRPSTRNSRSDYLVRLAQRIELERDHGEAALELLEGTWNRDLLMGWPNGVWQGYLDSISDRRNGPTYQLDPARWGVLAHGTRCTPQWYACDTCGRITLHNVRGVCPQYRCTGMLAPADVSKSLESNHYVRLYVERDFPWEMRAEEHTAQLKPEAAAQFQTDFQEGRINILSCSTTFELGVDLGDLETVLMKNVPPSAANYVQRAGRAGRRAGVAAMVVTYAQDRPHDAFHYREPDGMIRGHIRPPHFELDNRKIVLRHVYATALADFWRSHEEYWHTVQDFFLNSKGSGTRLLKEHLGSRPEGLKRSLMRTVPGNLLDPLGIDSWAWVDGFLASSDSDAPGVLALASEEVNNDIEVLTERYTELAAKFADTRDPVRLMKTIRERYLINYLASRNVLPRYGFPVDIVNLDLSLNSYSDRTVELQRDLRLAISEYAPDGQVVAGGKVWTSRYLKRVPQREWMRYFYSECRECGNYVTKLALDDSKTQLCDTCGAEVTCSKAFVVPEFGFIADVGEPAEPGEQRPERTHATRVFFSRIEGDDTASELQLSDTLVKVSTSKAGRLAVINEAFGQGFSICRWCGYAMVGYVKKGTASHLDPYGRECKGSFTHASLGYEFMTDIARLAFEPCGNQNQGFWYSLLYALIEGACMALGIERNEIDGCLQWGGPTGNSTRLVLFDTVPGGAGYVHRLADPSALRESMTASLRRLSSCTCGGETANGSCYGCLRDYGNQFCHDMLNRGAVIEFLKHAGIRV
ncbi:MAG: DEAD/DEAH box helicase [Clostridia bacterium]|nr:DEAD/DEAH box helicase [Clostridia bacterium]